MVQGKILISKSTNIIWNIFSVINLYLLTNVKIKLVRKLEKNLFGKHVCELQTGGRGSLLCCDLGLESLPEHFMFAKSCCLKKLYNTEGQRSNRGVIRTKNSGKDNDIFFTVFTINRIHTRQHRQPIALHFNLELYWRKRAQHRYKTSQEINLL